MEQRTRWIMLTMAATLPLLGCVKTTESAKAAKAPAHATVVAQDATKVGRITLSEAATKRLGIEFAEVKVDGERLQAPYNALLYDASGREWVFVSSAPNVYTRTDLKVETIEGDKVLYSKGPPAGTRLVTMGAAELYGIEFGVGK